MNMVTNKMSSDPQWRADGAALPEITAGRLEDCRATATVILRDYWLRKRAEKGAMPTLKDLNLMDLYRVASTLCIRDVIDGGEDFKNRYWGSGLTSVVGFDATGRLVSDYQSPELRKKILDRMHEVVTTGEPFMRRGNLEFVPSREYVQCEILHLPLSDGAGGVSHIISGYDFQTKVESGLKYPEVLRELRRR